MPKLEVTEELKQKIAELRYQGMSYERVGEKLGIAKTTARKYGPKDAKTVKLPHPDDPLYKYNFTQRQIDIAVEALIKTGQL